MVLEYAELAERYGVEVFAPMHEVDDVLGWEILREDESLRGYERASEGGQEILPEIRERYSGEFVWRAGLTQCGLEGNWAGGRWETFRDHAYINFTGYNYIGFTIYPNWIIDWEYGDPESEKSYREWLREVIDYAMTYADRDGCKGVLATEFGEERLFEEGEGRLSGFIFVFNEPDRIRYWYLERLP